MKQKTGIIGLVSGRLIKTRAKTGEKVTRSQSAKQALSAIIKKYGSVQDNVKYLHKGNRWTHIDQTKKAPESKKEISDKFFETLKGKFKVGDRVYNKIYRFEGTVIKINKQTMVMKGEPQYDRDNGLRKVPIDESMTTKL